MRPARAAAVRAVAAATALAAALLLGLALDVASQTDASSRPDAPRQRAAPPQAIAITNARVLAVSGPPLEGATVVMLEGRIVAVGSSAAVPPDARVIDAAGKTVTPGLLDSATHLGAVEIDLIETTADFSTEDDEITAAFNVADGINPFSTLIPITRVEGITRAVVMPESGTSVVAGQGILIDLSSAPLETSFIRNPVAMYAALGEAGAELAGGARGAAVLRLREVLQDALDYAANRAAFEANRRREYAVSRLDLEALVSVVRGEVPLAIRVDRASDILVALRLAREFRLRLVLLSAAEGWIVAEEIARAQVPVVLNPMTNIPDFARLGTTLENAARLHAAGVAIAFGTFDAHNSRNLKQAAGNAVANGLPHAAALEAVSLAPARIWGIADRYGSLEPGKDADLVIWSGDPFELTTRVERVFIRGVEMPKTTRQTKLLEAYRTLPRRRPARAGAPEPGRPAAPQPAEEGVSTENEGRGPGPGPEAPPAAPAAGAVPPGEPGAPEGPGQPQPPPPPPAGPPPAPSPGPAPAPPPAASPAEPAARIGPAPAQR